MYDLTRNRKEISSESENEVMSRVWNEYFLNLPDMEPESEEKVLYISRHPDFRYHVAKTDGSEGGPKTNVISFASFVSGIQRGNQSITNKVRRNIYEGV